MQNKQSHHILEYQKTRSTPFKINNIRYLLQRCQFRTDYRNETALLNWQQLTDEPQQIIL